VRGASSVKWHGDRAIDVLVTATATRPPLELGRIGPQADAFEAMTLVTDLVRFTMPFNVTGQPAVSVPMHWTADDFRSESSSSPTSAVKTS